MRRLMLIAILFMAVPMSVSAQFSQELKTIEIGTLSTTHVLFTSDLTYVDISMQDVIAAKIVEASKNMLALKARQEFDFTTTISALEANGTMHTFKVKYNPFPQKLLVDTRTGAEQSSGNMNTQIRPESVSSSGPVVQQPRPEVRDGSVNVTTGSSTSNFGKADAPTLEEIIRKPQELFHIGDRSFKLEAYCTNVYVYSDLMYIVLTVYNNSDIGYEAGDAQFAVENNNRKRNNLESDKDIWAKSSYGTLSCPPRGKTVVGYTIPKFTLVKNECLRVYIYEKKGSRNLVLTLTDKDINYAISPL